MEANTTHCEEVIITNLARRGKGVKHSPVRAIIQVYSKSGELIAENDPDPEKFTVMDLVDFTKWCGLQNYLMSDIDSAAVDQWLYSI